MKRGKGTNKSESKEINPSKNTNTNKKNISKKEALKTSPVAKILPNAVTITSMCFGLSSIRFSQSNELVYAVSCVLVSAFLDMFDGKIARLLDQSTAFGLELDSLSDLVCFGVAPSIALYSAAMKDVGIVGWVICMFYTVCCALRLARYNVTHADSELVTELKRNYFVGIPAPAGAILALSPLIFYFETNHIRYYYIVISLLFSGIMMISTVHTFSSKVLKVNKSNYWYALPIAIIVITSLILKFWLASSILIVVYLVMIPYAVYRYSETLKAIEAKN